MSIFLTKKGEPRKNRVDRSTKLSVTFSEGYVEGWTIRVLEAFKEALDIRLTELIRSDPENPKSKQTILAWTEGLPPCYAFGPGDIFYDTRAAYELPWGEALSRLGFAIQIQEASPDDFGEGRKQPGWVRANIYRPDRSGGALRFEREILVSQDEFVNILKTGDLGKP